MANEKLPIKFFAPREIDELRVEAGGSSDIPTWVLTGDKLTERASVLSSAFSQFESSIFLHGSQLKDGQYIQNLR